MRAAGARGRRTCWRRRSLVLFMGEYMHRAYHGRDYAKGQYLKWTLRQAYDDVLAK